MLILIEFSGHIPFQIIPAGSVIDEKFINYLFGYPAVLLADGTYRFIVLHEAKIKQYLNVSFRCEVLLSGKNPFQDRYKFIKFACLLMHNGRFTEWLGSGLQNHLRRFESATDLNPIITP